MLTPQGSTLLADAVVAALQGGRVIVSDGGDPAQTADMPITDIESDAESVIVTVQFGEDAANFEWRVRSLVREDGTEVDRTEIDQGRKVPGQIWLLRARVRFVPEH